MCEQPVLLWLITIIYMMPALGRNDGVNSCLFLNLWEEELCHRKEVGVLVASAPIVNHRNVQALDVHTSFSTYRHKHNSFYLLHNHFRQQWPWLTKRNPLISKNPSNSKLFCQKVSVWQFHALQNCIQVPNMTYVSFSKSLLIEARDRKTPMTDTLPRPYPTRSSPRHRVTSLREAYTRLCDFWNEWERFFR